RGEMRFAVFRREGQSFLHRLPGLRDTRRSVISSQEIKRFVCARELAVREIELWIMRHSLIQQAYRLAAVLDHTRVERCLSQRLLATQIAIIGDKVSRR